MTAAPTGATTRPKPAHEEPAPTVEDVRPHHRNPHAVPLDVHLEEAALGSGVLNRAAAEHVAAVRLDDWTSHERRAVAAAIRHVLTDDGTPDPVLVAHHAGVDLELVHRLIVETPAVSQAGRHCAVVARLGRLRRIVHRCAALSDAAMHQADDEHLAELLTALEREVTA